MIKSIQLRNIKSLEMAEPIELSNFTLLIGENGSGKSTILQTLGLFSQDPTRPSFRNGNILNLGEFVDLVRNDKKPIIVDISGKINGNLEYFEYFETLEYRLQLQFNQKHRHNYSKALLHISSPKLDTAVKSKLGSEDNTLFHLPMDRERRSQLTFQYPFYDTTTASIHKVELSYEPPFSFSLTSWTHDENPPINEIRNTLEAISLSLQSEFRKITYIPPLRGISRMKVKLLDTISETPVDSNDFENQSAQLASSLEYNRDIEEELSKLMESVIERKCRSKLEQNKLIAVQIKKDNRWINILNEGYGSNPLIALLYQVVATPKNSLILIEEPEIHLFPSAQKRLMASLINYCKTHGKRILMTTHSEHVYTMLNRYQETHSKDVNMYFLKQNEAGLSEITKITDENKNGLLKNFLASSIADLSDLLEVSGRDKND